VNMLLRKHFYIMVKNSLRKIKVATVPVVNWNRRYTLLLSALCLILYFMVGCGNYLKDGQTTSLSQHDRAMIDSIIASKFHSHPVPGLAVGLVVGDQIYTKTVGYSDAINFIDFNESTVFCTGVISETFTASLALALKHHFKVDLNEPISKYLPHFSLNSSTYKNITINHLLTQTSGVPRHGVFWDFPNMGDSALWHTTWSIRLQEPEFETPGTKVVRSPYNFDIAADLIAHASNSRFEDFVTKYLFTPLQMKMSTYDADKIFSSNYARPHQISSWLTNQFETTSDYPINGEHAGSIGWHTNIEEATRWISMLLNGGKYNEKQILPAKLVHQMMTPTLKTDQVGSFVGLGWEIKTINGTQVFIKAGAVGAFENALVMIPEFKMGVMVVVNAQTDFMPDIFAQELLFSIKNKNVPQYRPSIHYEMGRILNSTHRNGSKQSWIVRLFRPGIEPAGRKFVLPHGARKRSPACL